ncbi:uncharacterized protein LOC129589747 [Paramacrobiotus metropolitanus]|uniref:uncharacterized protein LOC129589747 n=1 Tax=Paramacrobiotus metropolitanus TaxID=2943436 RepID=UPI002445ECDD|nr:uncharacterized protein LOC129589747 [Paramacrobiotus metropolitanus]
MLKQPCRIFTIALIALVALYFAVFLTAVSDTQFIKTSFITPFRDNQKEPPNISQTASRHPLPNIVQDIVSYGDGDRFPVHIVRFYRHPPNNSHSFCWTECVSVLSILLYVQPSKIYIHTNYPEFWPFDACNMINNYSLVNFISTPLRLVINGRRIAEIQHEADTAKQTLLNDWKTGKWECLLSREDQWMNSGFIACRKGHTFIQEILARYWNDYRDEWLYNSGKVPYEIYNTNFDRYRLALYVDGQMATHNRFYSGSIRYREIPAWHSFYHSCEDNATNTVQLAVNSTFWEMLHFVLREGEKAFQTSGST